MLKNNFRVNYITNCKLVAQFNSFVSHALEFFPSTAHKLLGYKGKVLTQVGEIIMSADCVKIHEFEIMWNRSRGDLCYSKFPVNLGNNKTAFMDLLSREIVNQATSIPCVARPEITYIKNESNEYLLLDKYGKFGHKGVKFNISHLTKEIEFKDGIQVNASFFHKERFHPIAMLQLVADSEAVYKSVTKNSQ